MKDYDKHKTMLLIKYGSMKRAWREWCDSNILVIKVAGYSTEEILIHINNPQGNNSQLNNSNIEYVRREGFSDIETKIICDWHDERKRTKQD